MLKWIILAITVVVILFVIAFIKYMLKVHKADKQKSTPVSEVTEEYVPEESHIDIHSASSGVPVTDMSKQVEKEEQDFINDIMADFDAPVGGFTDSIDDEFVDYSQYARKSKGRRRRPIDFDLDGEMADEYIPSSEDFSYLPRRQKPKKKPIAKELNDLPTELKVLMLSDIFDRKFFD
jgi:hypothetical protein